MTASEIESALAAWYASNARDLPWRQPGTEPWAVLVSEFMLQQTPVSRVLPAYAAWLARWPDAPALAADSPGEAVRQWGRLGYPRRALRLHACAQVITAEHDGQVPDSLAGLRALPGVGAYTAAAVASFAFGKRHPVLDTNVRRVLARMVSGSERDGRSAASVAEFSLAESLLPPERERRAANWSVALMELGALVCTARAPRCASCPVYSSCRWVAAGRPSYDGPTPRPQRFAGTDRQIRGLLLDVLRNAAAPVSRPELDVVWHEAGQRERALASLVTDGLVTVTSEGDYRLPA
jgi:A/G-specific adenine glycosylase